MMEAARTSETSVDNYFTRQHIPEDISELHVRVCFCVKGVEDAHRNILFFVIKTTTCRQMCAGQGV
jgi:hypothetical protein